MSNPEEIFFIQYYRWPHRGTDSISLGDSKVYYLQEDLTPQGVVMLTTLKAGEYMGVKYIPAHRIAQLCNSNGNRPYYPAYRIMRGKSFINCQPVGPMTFFDHDQRVLSPCRVPVDYDYTEVKGSTTDWWERRFLAPIIAALVIMAIALATGEFLF